LDYLTPADLLSSACVCRRWLSLANDKLVIITMAKQGCYAVLGICHSVFLTVNGIYVNGIYQKVMDELSEI